MFIKLTFNEKRLTFQSRGPLKMTHFQVSFYITVACRIEAV